MQALETFLVSFNVYSRFFFLNVYQLGFTSDSSESKDLPAKWETWVGALGWEDSPEEGNDNPLQYSCLENSMDRGAWHSTVHGVPKNWT